MFPSRRITSCSGDKFRDEHSISFDGTNDHVVCGAFTNFIADNATSATFGVWMKSSDDGSGSDGSCCLIGERTGKNFMIAKNAGNTTVKLMYTEVNGGNEDACVSTTEMFDQQWHFIVGTYSSGVSKIYVDGVLEDTQDNSPPSGTDTQLDCDSANLGIGGESGAARNYYGKISDAFVYTSTLSANDVKTIYNNREPFNHNGWKNISTLKAWYRMGDGLENSSGTTIYDMSNNTNNGTMSNMAANDFTGDTP